MPISDPVARRAYQRALYHKRRDAWFRSRRYRCAHCGERAETLQVDHRNPRRKVTHRVFLLARERREAELKKCQALCTECHRLKSAMQLRGPGSEMYRQVFDQRSSRKNITSASPTPTENET